MANQRRRVQEAHERFTVGLFLENFNHRYHSDFKVVEEPVFCEAIIQSKRSTRWIEVTTAYFSKEFAMDVNSYATQGEVHKPSRQGFFIGPDAQFAEQFVCAVKKKLEKLSYDLSREKYGQGYLIVSIQYPLYDQDTLRYIRRAWNKTQVKDRNCFKSIYITYRKHDGYKVSLWRPYLIGRSRATGEFLSFA